MPLEEVPRPLSAEKLLTLKIAGILIEAWERAEGKKVNVSYYATFADMAKSVVDSGLVTVLD